MYMCHLSRFCCCQALRSVTEALWMSVLFIPPTYSALVFVLDMVQEVAFSQSSGKVQILNVQLLLYSTKSLCVLPCLGLCWTCCSLEKVGILHISGLCSVLEHRMTNTSCYLAFHCEGRCYGVSFRVCREDKAIESVGSAGTLFGA